MNWSFSMPTHPACFAVRVAPALAMGAALLASPAHAAPDVTQLSRQIERLTERLQQLEQRNRQLEERLNASAAAQTAASAPPAPAPTAPPSRIS